MRERPIKALSRGAINILLATNDFSGIWIVVASLMAAYFIFQAIRYRIRVQSLEKRRTKLRRQSGKPLSRDRDSNVYLAFLQHRNIADKCYVDDQTWHDLNLNSIFEFIDRTLSTPGGIELYRFLRCLETSPEALAERDTIISFLQNNPSMQEAIQLKLDELGHSSYPAGMLDMLWAAELPDHGFQRWVDGLAAASVVAACTVAITTIFAAPLFTHAVVATSAFYMINLCVHYRYIHRHGHLIPQLRYISKLVNAAKQLSNVKAPELGPRLQHLRSRYEQTRTIPATSAFLLHDRRGSMEITDLIIEYVSIISLAEVRAIMRSSEAIRKSLCDLKTLFKAVGELDAMQAISSYRCGLRDFTRPEFITGRQLQIENAVHPLLKDATPNSVAISKRQYLITGSNMSGKSTLLRTVGVNAVLAQSIFTCTASSYRGSFFRVMSSITPSDDLLQGRSYYLAEAERLHEMIKAADGAPSVLCIIDEVLRGTNTSERVAAATAILTHLSCQSASVFAATHDVELATLLAEQFQSHHFSEQTDHNGIHFDYQIRPGSAKSSNAIRLLEYLGYPDELVRRAACYHEEICQRTRSEQKD